MKPALQAGTRLKMKALYAGEGEIIHIGEGLMACSLKKEEWTHAADFAAALWLMRYRTDLELAAAMPGLIRAFNEAVGGVNSDTAGYHETITQASLRAACGVFESFPADMPVYRIVNALMSTKFANPNWLLEYWTRERLMSVEARRAWLEPDLKALPF